MHGPRLSNLIFRTPRLCLVLFDLLELAEADSTLTGISHKPIWLASFSSVNQRPDACMLCSLSSYSTLVLDFVVVCDCFLFQEPLVLRVSLAGVHSRRVFSGGLILVSRTLHLFPHSAYPFHCCSHPVNPGFRLGGSITANRPGGGFVAVFDRAILLYCAWAFVNQELYASE